MFTEEVMSDEHEGATLLACSMAALLVSYDGAPYLLTRPNTKYLLVPILDTKTNSCDTATSMRLTMEELVRLVKEALCCGIARLSELTASRLPF